MDAKTTAKPKMTISATVIRANGDIEELGVIATTEGPKPGIVRQLKDAWVEGWHEGQEKKDETTPE